MSITTHYASAAEAWHAMLRDKRNAGRTREQALAELCQSHNTLHNAVLVEANPHTLSMPGKSPEEQAIGHFAREVATLRANGMSDSQARDTLRREQPKLHAAYRTALGIAIR